MIIVHHLNNSRSQRILWMLEELGIAYEIKHYQRDPKTMLAPSSLKKIHPLGKSPVITDGDITVAESGAIIDYLANNYGKNLIPTTNSPEYRQYTYWMHFAEGSLMPPFVMKLVFDKVRSAPVPFFLKPVTKGIADKVMSSFIEPNIRNNMTFINDYLAKNEWFAGAQMTGADFQMSFPLEAAVAGRATGNYPHITAWVKRVQARPTYQKALQAGGPYDYA
ncbi:glutathione S-transferase [Moraxellaceae bacterium AER2_44_116]|nr:glutathione S-transferase [Moraxellaceae bacterium]TQC99844.1 glutathione S-transferase [Moraxellaceae bacterium AER2_44_116]